MDPIPQRTWSPARPSGSARRDGRRGIAFARGFPWALVAGLLAALAPAAVHAHKPSDSYLTLAAHDTRVDVRWDVALRDLDDELALDVDDDGALTWGEVRRRTAEIDALLLSALALRADGRDCGVQRAARESRVRHALDVHPDGTYAVLRFTADCGVPVRALEVDYRLFATTDRAHRGVVRVDAANGTVGGVLGPDAPVRTFATGTAATRETIRQFVIEGVRHIWIGLDHVLFLLALLLPSVLVRAKDGGRWRWQPVSSFAAAAGDVLRIVTAFTIAHSITLTLAVLGWVQPPPRLVESAIAATLVLGALNNVWPVVTRGRWIVGFGFGLVHGFGFAGALQDLGLPSGALATALASFNVGVELGQLAIVLAFVPAVYLVRATTFYRRGVVLAGSWAVAALAVAWFVERAWDVALLGS